MAKFGMRRSLWLVPFWALTVVIAGCSKSSPAGPSSTTGDAGPIILPYTGGPTSAPSSTMAVSSRGTQQEDIEGRVEGFPTAPAGAFVVSGRTVRTNSRTVFEVGGGTGSFADLAVGQRVHVTGSSTGGDLTAGLVRIQNAKVEIPIALNGVVLDFAGSASAFTFTIGTRAVRGDSQTEFFGGSTFGQLADDVRVNVKGLQRDGFVYAQRLHVASADDDGDVAAPPPPPPSDPPPAERAACRRTWTCP